MSEEKQTYEQVEKSIIPSSIFLQSQSYNERSSRLNSWAIQVARHKDGNEEVQATMDEAAALLQKAYEIAEAERVEFREKELAPRWNQWGAGQRGKS